MPLRKVFKRWKNIRYDNSPNILSSQQVGVVLSSTSILSIEINGTQSTLCKILCGFERPGIDGLEL